MYYVSVNSGRIRSNAKHKTNDPPLRVARSRYDAKPRYAHQIEIKGLARVVYSRDLPLLKCGARVVLVVEGDLEITE